MTRIFIFSLFVMLCFSFSFSQDKEEILIDGVFATVGSHVIFYSDIEAQITQYKNQGVEYNNQNLVESVVEDLFFQKMLIHFAEQDSIEIEPSEIENAINQRIMFLQEQLGSEKKVETYFNQSINEIIEELQPMIKNQLLVQKMQYEITKDVQVSPLKVQEFYHSFSVDSLPIIPEQFQVAQILKIPEAAELATEEVLSKLEDLRSRIVKGADFSTMAILYSEDPGSSRNGGSYYGIKKGDFVKEFESVAFSLDINELSEIFQTEYGYHIARLIDRRGNTIDVQHILMTPKISNQDMLDAKDLLSSLRLRILNNEISFSSAAEDVSSDKETRYNGGLLINPNTSNSFFSVNDLDPIVYNEIKLLSEGGITDPIYIKLPNGKEAYRIIQLVSKKDEHVANLEDDYSFLKNYCFQIQQEAELKRWYKDNFKNIHIESSEDLSQYGFYNKLLDNE